MNNAALQPMSAPATRAKAPARRGKRSIDGSVIAVAGFVALIALWFLSIRFLHVPSYILPDPMKVLHALWAGLAVDPTSATGFYRPLWSTLSNAAMGFAIGWLGFGDSSKIAIAALLAFFPLLINSFTGLRATEPERIDLMRSLSATRFEIYRIVKLPNAAPFIFAGLDMAVVYALLGAIVAEFLGAQQGMGVAITQAQSVSDVAGVFALLIILGVMGVLLHGAVNRIERRVVHWARRNNR
jgi:NitT/TauT family transport system permease protein